MTHRGLRRARFPAWWLPRDWPCDLHGPLLADVRIRDGRIDSLTPSTEAFEPHDPSVLDVAGAPVLPAFVDAHTHLDCAFTRSRIPNPAPGLLAGIAAKQADRVNWTAADLRGRAVQALTWAWVAGTSVLRTHVDWAAGDTVPTAWKVFGQLADEWRDRVRLERVALTRPEAHGDRASASRLARLVAAGGPGAKLGSFVHSSNWSPESVRWLFEAACEHGLDVDVHVDEELNPAAQGLDHIARLLASIEFPGRVVCGHNCALAVQPDTQALHTLDRVARAPITMVALPQNNLYLQDATPGRTPRFRGITLIKEARERAIPVLVGSDSVQDPFCPIGSFDPVEALMAAVLAAQLTDAFDTWSESICRDDWLSSGSATGASGIGAPCDLVIFNGASAQGWPSRAHPRTVLRRGEPIDA